MKNVNLSIESARQHIAFVATKFPMSKEAQYMKLGKWFSQKPLSKNELRDLRDMLQLSRAVDSSTPGECYMNAGRLALGNAEGFFQFVEGLAAGLWPVSHAWVEYKGRAIDVTWPMAWDPKSIRKAFNTDELMERVVFNIANCAYFGVVIPSDVLRKHVLKQKQWGPLFEHRHARHWDAFEKSLDTSKFPR